MRTQWPTPHGGNHDAHEGSLSRGLRSRGRRRVGGWVIVVVIAVVGWGGVGWHGGGLAQRGVSMRDVHPPGVGLAVVGHKPEARVIFGAVTNARMHAHPPRRRSRTCAAATTTPLIFEKD